MSDNLTVERPEREQSPLVDRLRAVECDGVTRYYRNPDGPEAAEEIEALRVQIDRLERVNQIRAWHLHYLERQVAALEGSET